MALIKLVSVKVLNNPAKFTDPFKFNIVFECTSELEQDLEWKAVYIGSAESTKYDQILECISLGPITVGVNRFLFETNSPDSRLIPTLDIMGTSGILLICSYLDQAFVKIGYYVNNDYEDPELLANPPQMIEVSSLRRTVIDEPRVTNIDIVWSMESLRTHEIPRELLELKVDESEISNDEYSSNEDSSSSNSL